MNKKNNKIEIKNYIILIFWKFNYNQLINNTRFVKTSKEESAILKILKIDILKTGLKIYIY